MGRRYSLVTSPLLLCLILLCGLLAAVVLGYSRSATAVDAAPAGGWQVRKLSDSHILDPAAASANDPLVMPRKRAPSYQGAANPVNMRAANGSGWQRLLLENFDASFPPAGWELSDESSADGGEYLWGQRSCRTLSGGYGVWAGGGGIDGGNLGCGLSYANNLYTWLSFGPFDLSQATAAELQFGLWADVEGDGNTLIDGVSWLTALDGITYSGLGTSGQTGNWIPERLDLTDVPDLGDVSGQPAVYLGWLFESNSSNSAAFEGAFIDDAALWVYTPPPPSPSPPTPPLPVTQHTTQADFAGGHSHDGTIVPANVGDGGLTLAAQATGVGAWERLPSLPTRIAGVSAVVAQGYLFAIGGNGSDGYEQRAYSAAIGESGLLDLWKETTPLPQALVGHSTVVANGHLFVVGGTNAFGAQNTVFSAPVYPDGTLGSWSTLSPLPEPLSLAGVVAAHGYLYVLGGLGSGFSVSDRIYQAAINADGTLQAWQLLPDLLPSTQAGLGGLAGMAAVVANDYIYILGGSDLLFMWDGVFRAPIRADGSLGEWEETSSLPKTLSNHGAVTTRGGILIAGGYSANDLANQKDVYWAPVQPDGSLGSWISQPDLGYPMLDNRLAASDAYVYNLGGRNMQVRMFSSVLAAPIQTSGQVSIGSFNHQFAFGESRLVKRLRWSETGSIGRVQVRYRIASSDGRYSPWSVFTATQPILVNAESTALEYQVRYERDDAATNDKVVTQLQVDLGSTQETPSRWIHTTVTDFEGGNSDGGFQIRQQDDGELVVAPTVSGLAPWVDLSATPLPQRRYLHTVTANDHRLYVIGGTDESGAPQATVYSTLQEPNGDLDNWQVGFPLPQPLLGHAVVSTGQSLLVIGGKTSLTSGHVATVYRATFNEIGEVIAWNELTDAPLPQPLAGHAAALVNGFLFVSGGRNPSNRQATVYRADVKADGTLMAWAETAPLPTPITAHKMAAVGNCLYVVGGETEDTAVSTVYAAQVAPNGHVSAWQDLAQVRLPGSLQDHVLLATHSALIVAGGVGVTTEPPFVKDQVYWASVGSDCALSAWQELSEATLPRALVQAAGIVIDDHLYIIGGQSLAGLSYDEVYRTQITPQGLLGAWQTLDSTPLPEAVNGASSIATLDRLYVTGGQGSSVPVDSVHSAHLEPGGTLASWRAETALPHSLAHHTLLDLSDRLLLIGGNDGSADTNAVYEATLGPDGALGAWTPHTCTLPISISYHAAVVVSDSIYVSGGRTGFNESDAVFRLREDDDGGQGCWESVSTLPLPLAAHAMSAAGDYLYISGGVSQSGSATQERVLRATINPDGSLGPWAELSAAVLPYPLLGHRTFAKHGYLYLLGGNDSLTDHHQLYRAAIQANGDLDAWQELTNNALPQGIFDHAIAYNDLYLFSVGGLRDGQPRVVVYSVPLYTGVPLASYIHRFDLGVVQDIGTLDWQARGGLNSMLGVRYRTASSDGVYGAWSTTFNTSPASVYEQGRYLQYLLLMENPLGSVGAVDQVGLTFGDVGDYVKVVDSAGAPVPDAAVYLNGQLIGTTNIGGVLPPEMLPRSFQPGDRLVALGLITQTETIREAHTTPDSAGRNWAYRIYTSNLEVNDTGQVNPYTVAQPGGQVVTLWPDRPLILYNLLISIEWDATMEYTEEISRAMRSASDYLYDISDGQMALGNVTIYDNAQHWADADIQISTKNIVRPHAYIGGVSANDKSHVIRLGRHWDGRSGNQGPWDASDGFRTLVHEFGHYALYLYDEYFAYLFGSEGELVGEVPGYCTGPENRNPATDAVNASVMDYQYTTSELSARGVGGMWSSSCEQTAQWQMTERVWGQGESGWETLVRVYTDTQSPPRWQFTTPMSRGNVLLGPDGVSADLLTLPTVAVNNTGSASPPRHLSVSDAQGQAFTGALVALYKQGGRVIGQGFSDSLGNLDVYGADSGDILRAASMDGGLSGSVTVGTGSGLTLTLTPVGISTFTAAQTGAVPHMRVIAEPSPTPDQIDLLISMHNFGSDADPSVVVTEPGSETGYAPTLNYSPGTGNYEGGISFSATQRGMGRISAMGAVGNHLVRLQSTYRLQRVANDQGYDVFSDDGNLSLHLEPSSLPGSEAYLVVMPPGALPGPGPAGLVAVGDPYDVTASGALVALEQPAVLKLRYDAALVGSVSAPLGLGIYRWDPNSEEWHRVPSSLDEGQRALIAPVKTLGTYALFSPLALENRVFLPIVLDGTP